MTTKYSNRSKSLWHTVSCKHSPPPGGPPGHRSQHPHCPRPPRPPALGQGVPPEGLRVPVPFETRVRLLGWAGVWAKDRQEPDENLFSV